MKNQRKERKKRFSFSLLSLSCPRRIHKTMARDQVEVFPAEETDTGRIIHSYLAEILSTEERDFSKLTNYVQIYGNPEKVFSNIKGKFSTEQKIRIIIGGKTFTTVSDLLVSRRGERDIIDHKTSFSQEVLPSHREQLQYYALPFLRQGLKVKVGIHFVRYARLEWIDILQGLDDYARIAKQLMERIGKMERILGEVPNPEPSNFECKYCPYVISCPLSPEYFITDKKQAARLAGEYIKLKSKLKKMEDILKIWATSVGHIHLKDCKVGFNPSTKTVIDQEATLEFLNRHNIPITEVFSAQATKFKKLAKTYNDLANFAEIKYGTRWGVVSTTDEEKEEQERFSLNDAEEGKKKVGKAVEEIEKTLNSAK
ncbi:hypothetical protein ES703_42406 [subsurface metagenome]